MKDGQGQKGRQVFPSFPGFRLRFLCPFLLILARRRNSFIFVHFKRQVLEKEKRTEGCKLFIFFLILLCCNETSNYIHDQHTYVYLYGDMYKSGAESNALREISGSILGMLAGEFPLFLSLAASLPAASLSKLFPKFKPLCERCAGNMTFKKFLPASPGSYSLLHFPSHFPGAGHAVCVFLPLLRMLLPAAPGGVAAVSRCCCCAADMWSRGCYAVHNICSLSKWLNTPGMLTYFAAFPASANLQQLTRSSEVPRWRRGALRRGDMANMQGKHT